MWPTRIKITDPLYKECNHGDLEPRKWNKVGEYFVLLVK